MEWSSHSLVAVQDSLHLLESLQAFRVRRQARSGHSGFKACVRSCALCCLRLHRNPPPAPRARLLALALLRWVRQQALLRARRAAWLSTLVQGLTLQAHACIQGLRALRGCLHL